MSDSPDGLVPPGPTAPAGPAGPPGPTGGPGPSAAWPAPQPGPPGPEDRPLGWTGLGLALAVCVPCVPVAGAVVAVVALARGRFRPRWVAVLSLVIGLGFTALQVAAVPSLLEGLRDGMNDALEEQAQEARESGERREIEPLNLKEGDCVDDPDFRSLEADETTMADTVVLVPCDQAHDVEVFATIRVPGDSFPGEAAIARRAERCLKLFAEFVGVRYEASTYEAFSYFPSKTSWRLLGDRQIQCTVGDPDEKVTGTLEGAGRGDRPEPGDEVGVDQLVVGDCYGYDDADTLVVRSCKGPHFAEVFAVFAVSSPDAADFPGEATLERRAERRCSAAFARYVGISYDDSRYEYEYWTPTEETWSLGDRMATCAVHKADESDLRRSVKGSRR